MTSVVPLRGPRFSEWPSTFRLVCPFRLARGASPTPKPFVPQYGLDISVIYAAGLARALNHSRALRFARVKVAEIQLYQAPQVKSGRAAHDLYAALGPHIDAARKAFRERFLIPLNGVPDYLHQELVKTLAKEDAVLLGPSYPGPLA